MSDREDFRRQVFGELTLFFPFSRSGEGEMDEERAVGNEVKREREAILPPPLVASLLCLVEILVSKDFSRDSKRKEG